jgi:membrane protein DedA with SNARE-associated domain
MHLILIYLGFFVGVFFEGEMVLISAIIAAHHGLLNLELVILIGLLATISSDNFHFLFGKIKGKAWLNNKKKQHSKVKTINEYIEKKSTLFFIFYRFLYGVRGVALIVLGSSDIKYSKFFIISTISSLVWISLFSILGSLFGEVLQSSFSHFQHYEKYLVYSIIMLLLLYFITKYSLQYYKKNKPKS